KAKCTMDHVAGGDDPVSELLMGIVRFWKGGVRHDRTNASGGPRFIIKRLRLGPFSRPTISSSYRRPRTTCSPAGAPVHTTAMTTMRRVVAVAVMAMAYVAPVRAGAQSLPSRLSDDEFWKL